MKKLCALSALTLTACGGGGGSTPQNTSISSTPSSVAVPEPVYYQEVKNAIPSLATYYKSLPCGRSANVYLMPSIDANNDKRKDLLAMLWCENANTVTHNNPGTNLVVSLIQNNDGTFRLGNQELFGKDIINLHGNLGEHNDAAVGDFNNDGRQDIALSPTLEDGRYFVVYADGGNNWDSHPVVILSQPDGTYKFEQLPYKGTLSSVIVIRENNVDKIAISEYIWSYENQKWVGTPANTKNHFIDTTTQYFDNNLVTQVFDGKVMGLEVGPVNNNTFIRKHFYEISSLRTVKIYGSNVVGDQDFSITTIDGVDWVMPAIPTSCSIPVGNGEILYFVDFQGIKLSEKYNGQKLEWTIPGKNGNVTWDNYYTKVLGFRISGNKITRLDTTAFNTEYKTTYGLSCTDVNADNQKDLILYRWGHNQEKSAIWLNKNSTFTEVPANKIPNISTIYGGHHSLITDLDGDNKAEIIYTPGLGYKSDYAGNHDDYQVYRAKDPL